MSKPIDKKEFWKERIEKAKRGREHYSVYITSDGDWDYLNKAHEQILKKEGVGRVLDAGCGYGRWSVLFKNYVGVDFSADFIEIAKSKYPDKEFRVADLKQLPFKDKEFDTAFCVSIKEMIVGNLGGAEWELMENELKRVAKQVLLLEYTNPYDYEVLN
jgi:ubiquinone/menaquinone biosynthesis C-methylase UbiE